MTKDNHPADHMLSIMLAMIDSAMNTTDENPTVFKITPSELSDWVDAVAEYEDWRFPDVGGQSNG